MDSLVALHFADLKQKKDSAWKVCFLTLLTMARHEVNRRANWLSEPVKTEIENDAVVVLYQKIDKFESPSEIGAFLRQTAKNKSIDEIRRFNRFDSLDENAGASAKYPSDATIDRNDPAALATLSETCSQTNEDLNLLAEALREIGFPCREYLTERYIDGAKEREIAEKHGLGASSMHNRIQTCVRKMKSVFERKKTANEEGML